MRLGKTAKFNMIIAILLCMAFVVNLGGTFAALTYTFNASSINGFDGGTVNYDTYTDYGYAQGTSGKYVYSTGTYNNQLSINYGFKEEYDLMIRFTAQYSNSSHSANDFSLNFANRDKWLLDMGTTYGLKVEDSNTVEDDTQVYYDLTSNSNTITGVMYYMGKLTNSGTLPVISGVTFYTSPNGAQTKIGDILTITLTPEYVKSGTYTRLHAFYPTGLEVDGEGEPVNKIADNWLSYMSGEAATSNKPKIMIYNAYVYDKNDANHQTPLLFPQDSSVIKNDGTGLVKPDATVPTYSNTAYRYTVNNGSRTYEALTAGNKYYGGLGVYVIPNTLPADASNTVETVAITVRYVWQKNGVIAGRTPSGVVSTEMSSDITIIQSGSTNYYYYCAKISEPTYINVLDHIRLTAENYETLIQQGYSLILNYISVVPVTSVDEVVTSETWRSKQREGYTITNSSQQSGVLVRVEDVLTYPKTYEMKLSITNNTNSTMVISSFSLRGYLWYGSYTRTSSQDINGEETIIETFKETPLGNINNNECYLKSDYALDKSATQFSPEDIWKYDTEVWSCAESEAKDGTYVFSYKSGVAYIPKGYTITLISGVTIPQTTACQTEISANDFWCSIEDVKVSASAGTPEYASITTTTGIETVVEGYYNEMTSANPGKIYIRNNTNQVITGVSLGENNSSLVVYSLTSGTKLPRDRKGSLINASVTSHLTGNISIKPNEMILAYTITPNQAAIIDSYTLTATLAGEADNNNIDLVYNEITQKGEIINNSTNFYEFRLVSTIQLTNIVSGKFIEKLVDGKYYYYYKGVICPHQCITIFNGVFIASGVRATTLNITINSNDKIVHNSSWGENHYVASNYAVWSLNDVTDKAWFDAMKVPYLPLTDAEKAGAVVL